MIMNMGSLPGWYFPLKSTTYVESNEQHKLAKIDPETEASNGQTSEGRQGKGGGKSSTYELVDIYA